VQFSEYSPVKNWVSSAVPGDGLENWGSIASKGRDFCFHHMLRLSLPL